MRDNRTTDQLKEALQHEANDNERSRLRAKIWNRENRQRQNDTRKKWISDTVTADRQKAFGKARAKQNRVKLSEQRRSRIALDPIPAREYAKKYRSNNKERLKKQKRQYDIKNREKINEYQRRRRKTDSAYRLLCNGRRRLSHALKITNIAKTQRFVELLGCTPKRLVEYLQDKFTGCMTWTNYGTLWEVDHIKPCSSFDLAEEKQMRLCFHYSNLQPLLKTDNRIKGSDL
jgi:hypothetical protein